MYRARDSIWNLYDDSVIWCPQTKNSTYILHMAVFVHIRSAQLVYLEVNVAYNEETIPKQHPPSPLASHRS